MEEKPIIKEVIINASASKIWEAISEKEKLSKWFMSSDDYKPELNSVFHMTGKGKDCYHIHTCRILEIIPEKKFSYIWEVEGIHGETLATFDLEEKNGMTKLTLTHSGWDKVTVENPVLSKEEHNKGWEHLLLKSLKELLEK